MRIKVETGQGGRFPDSFGYGRFESRYNRHTGDGHHYVEVWDGFRLPFGVVIYVYDRNEDVSEEMKELYDKLWRDTHLQLDGAERNV